MPIEFVAFTLDRRITGTIPLADDRLSDMLNSVTRIVLRDATVGDLDEGGRPEHGDVTLPVGDLVAVVATGRRGSEAQRRRTAVRRVRMGIGRYTVSGLLHLPPTQEDLPHSSNPHVVLSGREILVPITDATITYDCAQVATTERHETLLVNRARTAWIDIDEPVLDDRPDDPAGPHSTYLKDFTGSVAE